MTFAALETFVENSRVSDLLGKRPTDPYLAGLPLHPTVSITGSSGKYVVHIRAGETYVLRFSCQRYPTCCAMMLLTDFWATRHVQQDFVDGVLDRFFSKAALGRDFNFNSRRIMIACVEVRDGVMNNGIVTDFNGNRDKLIEPVKEIDAPIIEYPQFRNYMKKQLVCRTLLIPNINSGHIVHFIEAIIDNKE